MRRVVVGGRAVQVPCLGVRAEACARELPALLGEVDVVEQRAVVVADVVQDRVALAVLDEVREASPVVGAHRQVPGEPGDAHAQARRVDRRLQLRHPEACSRVVRSAVVRREEERTPRREDAPHLAEDGEAVVVPDHAEPVAAEHGEEDRSVGHALELARVGVLEAHAGVRLLARVHHLGRVVDAEVVLAHLAQRRHGASAAHADVEDRSTARLVADPLQRRGLGPGQAAGPLVLRDDLGVAHRAAIVSVLTAHPHRLHAAQRDGASYPLVSKTTHPPLRPSVRTRSRRSAKRRVARVVVASSSQAGRTSRIGNRRASALAG